MAEVRADATDGLPLLLPIVYPPARKPLLCACPSPCPAVTIGLWPSRDERGVRRPRRRAAHPHAPPRPAGTAGTTFQGGKPTVPTATALPPTLRARLTALARRIRRLRLLRGVSLLVLALVLPAAGLFVADAWLGLPLPALRGALAALAGGAVLAAVLGLVLPLRRKPDPGAL